MKGLCGAWKETIRNSGLLESRALIVFTACWANISVENRPAEDRTHYTSAAWNIVCTFIITCNVVIVVEIISSFQFSNFVTFILL